MAFKYSNVMKFLHVMYMSQSVSLTIVLNLIMQLCETVVILLPQSQNIIITTTATKQFLSGVDQILSRSFTPENLTL